MAIMRFWLVFLVAFFSGLNAWAIELGSIRGRVIDKSSGAGIVGAKILVKVKEKVTLETITDDDGTFIIDNIPNGTYDVEAKIAPYIGQKYVGVQVKSGVRPLYFRLTYNSNPNDKSTRDKIDIIYTYASLAEKERRIVTTATGEGDAKLDIPATGYLISNDDINNRGYTNLLEVLRDIPEIQIQEKIEPQIHNYITARGITGSGAFLIMQNGVRINSMTASDVVIAQNIPVRHMQSIEIIIGPASSLYGADAYAGVINMLTIEGKDLNGASIQTSSGMFNTTDNTIYAGFGNSKRWLSGMVSYYRTDNPYYPKYYPKEWDWYTKEFRTRGAMNLFGDTVSPYANISRNYDMHQEDMALNLQGYTNGWLVSLGYQSHSNSSAQGYQPQYNAPISSSRYKTSQYNFSLQYTMEITKQWSVNFAALLNGWSVRPISNFNNVFTAYNSTGYKYAFELGVGGRITANYKINDNHRLSFGVSGNQIKTLGKTSDLDRPWKPFSSIDAQDLYYPGSDIQDWQGNSLKVPMVLFSDDRTITGEFIQYQGDISKKLILNAGLRFDVFRFTNIAQSQSDSVGNFELDLVPSYRVGLVYKPTDSWRFKLFTTKGFMSQPAQTALEHYGSFTARKDSLGRVVGLQSSFFRMPLDKAETGGDVEEQISNNFEGSVLYTKGNFTFGINGFFNHIQNIPAYESHFNETFQTGLQSIDTLNIPIAVVEHLAVAHNADIYGGTIRADYGLTLGRNADKEFRIMAAYTHISGNFIELDSLFQNDEQRSPDYTAKHNIKTGLEFRYKQFRLYHNFIYCSPTNNEVHSTDSQWQTPSYWYMNLFAKYDLFENVKTGLNGSLFIKIQNLTNNRYYNMGLQNFGYLQFVPQQPFTILAGITVNFTK
jgi:iron complex outermembrane receptor protein